jgi:hypothetical protein
MLVVRSGNEAAGSWPALLEQLWSLLVLQQHVQHAFMYIPQIRELYPAAVLSSIYYDRQQSEGLGHSQCI